MTLYNSFDLDLPADLQDTVFIDFMMYFCNRGRENLCEIKNTDFSNELSRGMYWMMTNNHKGDMYDSASQGRRIYRTRTIMCPYSSCYGPDSFLLQGHAVTLNFKVTTQMLLAARRLNMVIISVKYFWNGTSNNEVMGQTRFCCKVMLWPWPSR